MTLRKLDFHSSQCSSVPSNFSGRARPFRSTMEAAVVVAIAGEGVAAAGPVGAGSGSTTAISPPR
eukprot:16426986-Heterocapsa_arctica.AAC.1